LLKAEYGLVACLSELDNQKARDAYTGAISIRWM